MVALSKLLRQFQRMRMKERGSLSDSAQRPVGRLFHEVPFIGGGRLDQLQVWQEGRVIGLFVVDGAPGNGGEGGGLTNSRSSPAHRYIFSSQ